MRFRFVVVFTCLLLLAPSAFTAAAQRTIGIPSSQPTIQAGINLANDGDTVLVAPGTYHESLNFHGKAITVTSVAGAATTIVDATGIANPVAILEKGEPRAAVLNGFTLRGGGTGAGGSGRTGGVYIASGSPTISNNVITANYCYGIYSQSSSPLIQGNEIDNTLDDHRQGCSFAAGAAIWLSGSLNYYNEGPDPTNFTPAIVQGNTLQNNTQSGREDAGENGGVGVAIWGAYALLQSNIIRNNYTLGEAAVLSVNTDLVSLVNNLIYNNIAAGGTAGVSLHPPGQSVGPFTSILANNTLYNNTLPSLQYLSNVSASDLALDGNLGQYVLVNNIVLGTMGSLPALSCSAIYGYLSLTPLVLDHNNVVNAAGGVAYGPSCADPTSYGNLSILPRFVNAGAGDFHLQPGSPAVDSGNTSAPALLPNDLDGTPRVQDATHLGYPVVDMGVYEVAGVSETSPSLITLTPSTYYSFYDSFFGAPPAFTLTAALTAGGPVPMGPVTFYEDGTAIGTLPLDAAGKAVLQPGVLPGLHAFVATYPGQGPFTPAVSVKFYVLFPKATPSLTLASSINPSVVAQNVTFTVQGSSSDGMIPNPILLTDNSTGATLATVTLDTTGKGTFTTNALSPGTHPLTASFAGSDTDNATSASLSQVVTTALATSTALTSSANPSMALQPVTFTAHVATAASSAGVPAGTVSFLNGNTTLATLPLDGSGSAAFTTASLPASPRVYFITAQFNPSGNFASSSARVDQVVDGLPASVILVVTPLSGQATDTYTMTATVANASSTATATPPSGTVNFYFNHYGASANYATLVNGIAILKATDIIPGQSAVVAGYNGDTVFAAANSNTITLTIYGVATTLTLTSPANPAHAGTPVILTAHLGTADRSPVPAGTQLQLSLGAQPLATLILDASGSATYPFTQNAPGSYAFTLAFAGKNDLLSSAASLTETLTGIPTTTTLSAAPDHAYEGQAVTLTATVSAMGSTLSGGPVSFYDGGTLLGTAPVDASGQAVLSTTALSVGLHALTAAFPAGPVLLGSISAIFQEAVLPSSFTLVLVPPTVTVATGAPVTSGIKLTSIGNFAGPLTLRLAGLPAYAGATFDHNPVTLTNGSTSAVVLTFTTVSDPGPVAATRIAQPPARSPSRRPWVSIALASLLLPFALYRRRGTLARCLTLLATVALLQTLTGCGELVIPFNRVAPGTYRIPVTATDSLQRQQSATLTLIVTP